MTVKAFRAKAKQELGQLAQVFQAAMRLWDADKAAGMPLAERLRNLEQTFRAAWPQTREWKYLCQQCQDYGLIIHDCPGDRTCGRYKAHLPHTFGRPCVCDQGARYVETPRFTAPDDHKQAGKSKFSRAGR